MNEQELNVKLERLKVKTDKLLELVDRLSDNQAQVYDITDKRISAVVSAVNRLLDLYEGSVKVSALKTKCFGVV